MNEQTFEVLRAYLCDSFSHRKIQREILGLPAPAKGGGFKAMNLLHEFGVVGDHKGLLTGQAVTRENIITKFESAADNGGFLYPDEIPITEEHIEGSLRRVYVNSYERSSSARKKCINHFGFACAVCTTNFKDKYGDIGENFIHVHHLKPLSGIGSEYKVDPINALIPVCPNCHSMLHKKEPPFTIEELALKFKSS